MNNEVNFKAFFAEEVGKVTSTPVLYKYIDFSGGIAMLDKNNIQFTQVRNLNDPYDCIADFIDIKGRVEKVVQVAGGLAELVGKNFIESLNRVISKYGICSLSSTNRGHKLWEDYANNHSGICIGLNTERVLADLMFTAPHFVAYPVNYYEPLTKIDGLLLETDEGRNKVFHHIFTSKGIKWQPEKEIRLISLKEINDEPGIVNRYTLSLSTFSEIYIGENVCDYNKKSLIELVDTKYKIPVYEQYKDALGNICQRRI